MRKRKQSRNIGTSSPCNLQTLIHALGNSKSFNQPLLLNSLYAFLLQLSSHSCPVAAAASSKFPLSSDYFSHLCDALFRELDNRFQQLFSALCNVSSQQSHLLSSLNATSNEFTMLLRCCLVIMVLPQLDQNMVFDKGNFLLSVFKRLCSVDVIGVEPNEEIEFRRSLFQKSTSLSGLTSSVAEDFIASVSFVKASDSCLPLLCALYEVFADEFLVHKSLRENLMLFDCLSSHGMLFVDHSSHGDVRNVMELIACHFILSFSNEQFRDSVIDRLSWHRKMDKKVPLLGLDQSVSLLLDPTFLSAPEIFQTHLILMVSEAIGIEPGCMSTTPDARLINCYLLAFERSVILYTRHIYALHVDGETLGVSGPESRGQAKSLHASFDCFIRPATRHHFDRLLSKLDDNWHSWTKNAALRTKAERVSISFAYVEENQELFVNVRKEKMKSFIEALILVASDSEEVTDSTSCKKIHASLPHMFLTASILKSMNASLLQALRCLEKIGKLRNSKLLKDFNGCNEYDFIVRVISCFQKLSDCLPTRRHPLVCDLLQGSKFKHKESKQMVIHFSSFLSLGFQYKLEFLVKGCIFALMTLLNLVMFEDGHLDALNPLLVYLSGASNDSFQGKLNEAQAQLPTIQKSSHLVASKFQKIQTLFSSQSSPGSSTHVETENPNGEASAMHMNEETCNGEMYLNCLFENSKKPSDIDDLADFIECKRGKDYSEMLKVRRKYRKRKVQKMAIVRWQKIKRTWQSIKGEKAH